MHAVQINFFVDPERRSPSELLDDWFSLTDIAAAVASTGLRVTVIQASTLAGRIEREGVAYHFVVPERDSASLTRSEAFRALLPALSPDVFHVHGLGFGAEVIALRALAPKVPILLQDHADHVPRLWRRRAWRRGAAAADGISFCAREQAAPFYSAGLLEAGLKIFEIPEWTSPFMPGDRAAARAATGIEGDPAILWVGHLNRNKDPMTVLDGVSAAARELPQLQLWCCYASAPLLRTVRTRVARDPALRDRVHLLGRVPHEKIERLMQAADLFVLASHREGSSFSLIEALATGLTPVATDIPSARVLTGHGTIGALWPPGDSRAFSEALRAAAARLSSDARLLVRSHFDERLSGAVIGRQFATAYEQLARVDANTSTGLEVA